VFCQPRLGFVQTDTIKGFGIPKQGLQGTSDPNVSGTARRVLATALGHAQRPVEHLKRGDKGACIDGSTTEVVIYKEERLPPIFSRSSSTPCWNI
jgi:hypothetical protein